MPEGKSFVDTNVLIYLLSSDSTKADKAELIIQQDCLISVQILNEISNVARQKLDMPWPELNEFISLICSLCSTEPLTIQTHEKGRFLAQRYQLNLYDAMIIASALIAGCTTLYSEDMQNGMLVEKQLVIRNPFHTA